MKKIMLGLIVLSITYKSYGFDFKKIGKSLESVYLDTKRDIEKKAPKVFEALEEFSEDVSHNVKKHGPKVVEGAFSLYKKAMGQVKEHGPEALREAKRLYLEAKEEIIEDVQDMLKDVKNALSCPHKEETSSSCQNEEKSPFYPVTRQSDPSHKVGSKTSLEGFDHIRAQEKTDSLYSLGQNMLNTVTLTLQSHEDRIEAIGRLEFHKKSSLSKDAMQERAYSELKNINLQLSKMGTIRLYKSKQNMILEELDIIHTNFQNNFYSEELSLEFQAKINALHDKLIHERELFEENFRMLLQNFYLRLSEDYGMTQDEVSVFFTTRSA